MVLAQQGLVGAMQSIVDLTYLADTVVLSRYYESRGEVKQALSVIKKRSGNHERTIREMRIGKNGISLGEPLRDLQGVLTGVPSFRQRRGGRSTTFPRWILLAESAAEPRAALAAARGTSCASWSSRRPAMTRA